MGRWVGGLDGCWAERMGRLGSTRAGLRGVEWWVGGRGKGAHVEKKAISRSKGRGRVLGNGKGREGLLPPPFQSIERRDAAARA